MRFIDADKLAMISHGDTEDAAYDEGYCSAINWFKEIIDEAPTVDAIPVEWLKNLQKDERATLDDVESIDWILVWWQQEQEAR